MRRLAADIKEMLSEQYEYRELLVQMTKRDLRLRYKQSIMGFGWAIFMPLVNTLMFSLIFTRVARIETSVPYPIYVYSGLLAWNFFASSLRFSIVSLASNTNLVTKVYFPREIFPFSAVLVSLVDFATASTILIAMMIWYDIAVTPAILFLPVIIVVQIVFTVGVALLVAMSNLFYRDIKYLFEIILTVWMFATSVMYPIERVGGKLAEVMRWNPMTPIIDGYRAVLLRGELPEPAPFVGAAVLAAVVLAVGWVVFHRSEFTFAERV